MVSTSQKSKYDLNNAYVGLMRFCSTREFYDENFKKSTFFGSSFKNRSEKYVYIDLDFEEKKALSTAQNSFGPENLYLMSTTKEAAKSRKNLYDFLKRNKILDLNIGKNIFEGIEKREFDISKIMVLAADNTIKKEGSAFLFSDKKALIFEGLDKYYVANKIRVLLSKVDKTLKGNSNKVGQFILENKEMYIRYQKSTPIAEIYLLYDNENNSVILKRYTNNITKNNGETEIALYKQMKADGVNDIPEFYMANAANYRIDKDGTKYQDDEWLISENITEDSKPVGFGISWKDWTKKYGLVNRGNSQNSASGSYLTDLSGITHENYSEGLYYRKSYNFLKSELKEKGKTPQEIIDSLEMSLS